jgi:hypothetical protein
MISLGAWRRGHMAISKIALASLDVLRFDSTVAAWAAAQESQSCRTQFQMRNQHYAKRGANSQI